MLMQYEKEHLVGDIVRFSLESVSLNDFSQNLLPLLEKLLDSSGSLLYKADQASGMLPIGGRFSNIVRDYEETYRDQDPLFAGLMMRSPKIQRVGLLPEFKEYIQSPTYLDFTRPNEMKDFYHLVLGGGQFQGHGSLGIIIARSEKQPEFEDLDGILLAKIYPALEALARRSFRLENHWETLPVLNSLVEQGYPQALAVDFHGRLLWGAEAVLKRIFRNMKGRKTLPEALVVASRQLGKFQMKKADPGKVPFQVNVPVGPGEKLIFQLHLSRTRTGEPFIIAQLVDTTTSPALLQVIRQYQLTPSEHQVLHCLGQGLADREISKRLCISIPTVRTHVSHILAKLGVASRVQAALLSHGIPVTSLS